MYSKTYGIWRPTLSLTILIVLARKFIKSINTCLAKFVFYFAALSHRWKWNFDGEFVSGNPILRNAYFQSLPRDVGITIGIQLEGCQQMIILKPSNKQSKT